MNTQTGLLNSKLPATGIKISIIMSRMAAENNAINLSQGSRTRMIFLNSPHNPTGSVINESDIKKLEDITSNKDIFVLSDEVYEHIGFDDRKNYKRSANL